MTQDASAVQLLAVEKRFGPRGDTVAVRGVTLAVPPGAFVAVLGPSGCGKTTTLRMVAGFEHPSAGEIRIRGTTVSAPARAIFVPPEGRRIGMVFQSYAVWPHMTVAENVGYPLRLRRVPPAERGARVEALLELTRLDGLGRRYPHQLSGGQQQRVALARALAAEPAVLLLDEPLSNLDARLRQEMRVELKAIQRRVGTAILYVTHDQDEALALADRVAVMGAGILHQVDRPEVVYDAPADRFVAEFLGYGGFLAAEVAGPGRVRVTRVPGSPSIACRVPPGAAGPGVLAFRPAQVALVEPGAGLAGRVVARAYRGEFFEYRIRLGPHEFAATATRAVAEGEPVRVALRDPLFFAAAT
ncbi:MAG: ABC transporter ATP-binding protein [Candidatus Rokubacteria bacterium]|nr:ABC transporter ATP-binding protein [Candidatus Rokubacteria bacterium]